MGLIDRFRQFLTGKTPATEDYRPWPGSAWMRHAGKRPQLTLWQIDQMEHDPKLRLATAVADAPLLDLEIEIESERPEVAAFVKQQFEKLWSIGNRKILRSRRYGYAGFEVMYRTDAAERIVVDGLRDLHPRDVRPLTRNGMLVGMRVKNIGVDLPTPKALWVVHDQRWGYWFGRSEYENSWPAYYEKWMNDGAIDKRILRMVKDAWIGDVIYYDPSYAMLLPDGTKITGRDLAREAAENRNSGGVLSLPNDSNATTGQKRFEYQPPTSVDGATPIFEYISVLDGEITEGQGVPREILDAAEAGGYSGRSIPMLAWLKSADVDAAEILAQVDDQILWPLAKLAFGLETRCYRVKHRPLVETFTKNLGGGEEGRGEAGARPPGQTGQANGFSPFRSNGAARFGGGPLQFSDDVLQLAQVHAPQGGVTIAGKFFKGGEFIPGEVLAKASPAQKQQIAQGIEIKNPKKERAERGELKEARREDATVTDAKGKTKKQARLVYADGSQVPDWVPAGKIPGAWKNVRVATDPNKDVWAVGVDEKGRTKTVYSDSYEMRQAAIKFARNMNMIAERETVQDQIQRLRESDDPATREAAACLWLIEEQATRPGSDKDTKAKKKAYGATTLTTEHVIDAPDGVRLQFVGKEGVWHDHKIRNPALAKELLRRKRESKTGKLFDTNDTKVLALSKQLDHGRFTPKDFRTLKATTLAIEAIRSRPKPADAKERQKAMMEVATVVSGVLGNRPKQALESYINPMVWSAWNVA